MRCLLDKVTARHIMEGMLKLVEGRTVTSNDQPVDSTTDRNPKTVVKYATAP